MKKSKKYWDKVNELKDNMIRIGSILDGRIFLAWCEAHINWTTGKIK